MWMLITSGWISVIIPIPNIPIDTNVPPPILCIRVPTNTEKADPTPWAPRAIPCSIDVQLNCARCKRQWAENILLNPTAKRIQVKCPSQPYPSNWSDHRRTGFVHDVIGQSEIDWTSLFLENYKNGRLEKFWKFNSTVRVGHGSNFKLCILRKERDLTNFSQQGYE